MAQRKGKTVLTVEKRKQRGPKPIRDFPRRGRVRHPWEEWWSKSPVVLEKGLDFSCSLLGMLVSIRVAAKRYGIRVRCDMLPGERIRVTVKGPR